MAGRLRPRERDGMNNKIVNHSHKHNLERTLRADQRDVAQRVPQRAQKTRGLGNHRRPATEGNRVLTAQLKEQAAQIQKVSAQLEMSKSAPQVVANKQ